MKKYDIKKIISKEMDIKTEREKLNGKIIKRDMELPFAFPPVGKDLKVGMKVYRIHSVDIPTDPDKNKIINVI